MKGYLQKVVEFAKFRFAAISINSYDKAKRMLVKKIVVVHSDLFRQKYDIFNSLKYVFSKRKKLFSTTYSENVFENFHEIS